MAEVRFLPVARDDLLDARDWYEARSPQSADSFDVEIDRIVDLLATRSMMFPAIDETHRAAKLHGFPYMVVYRLILDTVAVIAVVHTSRKPGSWRDRT